MPKVSKSRARRRTTRGRSTKTARRKISAVVNPRPRRRRSYTHAAPRRRRSYRRNPAELMELGAMLNPLTKTQMELARAMRSRAGGRQSVSSIASVLRAKPGMVGYALRKKRRNTKKVKKAPKPRKKGKARKYKKSKARRASRVLRFHVPKGRRVGKVRVEFNPRLNWAELKDSAKVAFFATVGFAGASMLTNLVSAKLFGGSGTGAAVGPLKSPTVVSILLAVAVPFLPIQAPWKRDLVTGVLVHAASRLLKDMLPSGSAIQQHLPGTLGEFALAGYIPSGMPGGQFINNNATPQVYFDQFNMPTLQSPLQAYIPPTMSDYQEDMRGVDEFGSISVYNEEF
jgi:hypothetical protein